MLLHCDWRVNIVFPDHFLSYSVARCFILCNAWSWLDPPSPAHFCSPFFYILNALLFPFRLIDWSDCFVFCHVLSHFAKTPNIPAPPLSSSDPPSIVCFNLDYGLLSLRNLYYLLLLKTLVVPVVCTASPVRRLLRIWVSVSLSSRCPNLCFSLGVCYLRIIKIRRIWVHSCRYCRCL